MPRTIVHVSLAGLLAFVVYPLSFAPMLRVIDGEDYVAPSGATVCLDPPTELPGWTIPYRPLIYLSGHPSLHAPLNTWAEIWGVSWQQLMWSFQWSGDGGMADDGSLLEMLRGA